jgi:branched-chain amino acid transport system substrate-binding protein
MKNVFVKLFISLILIIALFDALYADSKFKVGVIAPLSGTLAEYGVATRNGFEMAVKDNPENFKNIEFVFEDSQYDPKTALSAYRKLRLDKDVKVIFNWGSNPSGPLVPVAERECFPLVVADTSMNYLKQEKCVIGFSNSGLDLGNKLASSLVKDNLKKISLVKVENAYINGVIEGLAKALGKDIELEIENTVEPSENDFRSLVTKLKNKKIDALGIFLYTGQVSLFYQQLHAQKLNLKTFGTDFFESKEEIGKSGVLIQGAVYPNLNTNQIFTDEYTKEFQSSTHITHAGLAYDYASLTAKLFYSATPSITYANIINAYKNSGAQEGVLGKYEFSESSIDGPRFRFPVYLKRIKGTGYEIVE